ncbi:MAG: radical SAM protein [Bacteroidales bacterium]|jgi:uncharacterized protein|nr:radical SAM protein [Bacteroidales bacterium]
MKKQSEYNIVVENGEKSIYFNSYSGASVGLNKKEHQAVKEEFKNLENFETEYPNIFQKFYDFGFIIDEERNEKEEILFHKKQGVFLDREYRLFINPTLDCNFNCWYCYEEHPKGKMTNEVFEKIKKHIELKSKEISGLHLSWFGGEPLMYFDEIVYPMSLFAKNLMQEKHLSFINSITTNAYYINQKMIERIKEIDLRYFQITLDGNKEKHDKVRKHYGQPTFDIICNNIIELCNTLENVHITLRINYDEQTLNYGLDFLKNFPEEIRYKINIDFQRVWQTYSQEQEKQLNKQLLLAKENAITLGFQVQFWRFFLHEQYACYVDHYQHLEVNYDGKIYRCTAKGYKPEYEVGSLDENGVAHIIFDRDAKQFCKLTVENDLCLNCKYLPMCGGACWQNYKTFDKPICIHERFEIPFETAIIKNYEYKNKFYEISKKLQNTVP